jgi:thioesterase domain-containing protein/peptidoglycan/xylan/chitin deacetylase (PgdA/CDA1 family)
MDNDAASLLCGTPDLPPDRVALTFDDGPGPHTAELARLLHDEGVPGTFFVLGESIERHGDALATIRECGHVIGLHADQHRPFKSASHAAAELSRCAERVREHLAGTAWFRPPYGMGDWPVSGFAGPVGWHASGRDWDITYRKGQTVGACVDTIVQQLIEHRGGIALLHDFVPTTEFRPAGLTEADLDLQIIEITRLLIERLRAAGLSFCALPPASEPKAAPTSGLRSDEGATREDAGSKRPAASERENRSEGGIATDLQSLRTFRSTAKAAGGTLDLVMPMRVGGDGPAVFFAHPMIGLSWAHLTLLPHIDPRYPLYGLQARGLRRPEPLPVSMTEMAQDYADQIRMIQPHGPYQLFGWSLGGNIAFAIAEELESRAEEIGLLVILDSNLTTLDRIRPSNEPWMIYNLILAQFGYVPALTPADAEPEARMLELVRQRPGLGLDDWPEQRLRAMQRVIKNNVIVAGTHKPGRVHAPMLFVSAAQNQPALAEKVEGWRSFIDGPIEVVEVDCDHRHMLLPHLAAQIGIALSEQLERLSTPIV